MKNEPKNIRGYIELMSRDEKIPPALLKGYDDLPESDQQLLSGLTLSIFDHLELLGTGESDPSAWQIEKLRGLK